MIAVLLAMEFRMGIVLPMRALALMNRRTW